MKLRFLAVLLCALTLASGAQSQVSWQSSFGLTIGSTPAYNGQAVGTSTNPIAGLFLGGTLTLPDGTSTITSSAETFNQPLTMNQELLLAPFGTNHVSEQILQGQYGAAAIGNDVGETLFPHAALYFFTCNGTTSAGCSSGHDILYLEALGQGISALAVANGGTGYLSSGSGNCTFVVSGGQAGGTTPILQATFTATVSSGVIAAFTAIAGVGNAQGVYDYGNISTAAGAITGGGTHGTTSATNGGSVADTCTTSGTAATATATVTQNPTTTFAGGTSISSTANPAYGMNYGVVLEAQATNAQQNGVMMTGTPLGRVAADINQPTVGDEWRLDNDGTPGSAGVTHMRINGASGEAAELDFTINGITSVKYYCQAFSTSFNCNDNTGGAGAFLSLDSSHATSIGVSAKTLNLIGGTIEENGTPGVTQTCTVNQALTLVFTKGLLTGGSCTS